MPIYEYRCEKCGHELEAMQKMADAPLSDCPECQEPALKKLISAAGFRLSGGGWYETDFKSDNEQKRNIHGREDAPAAKTDGAETSSGSTSSDTAKPAETKPAAKKAATAKPAARSKPAAKPVSRAKPAKPAKAAKRRASR